MNIRFGCWLCLLFVAPAVASAADSPQWRGPNRDGICKETGLLKEWPKDGPKLVWRVAELGDGFSTPSVVGDKLYLVSNKGLQSEYVQAVSAASGKQIWSTPIGKVGNPDQQPSYPAARSTPTVDGKAIYALSSDGDLACLETETGKIRWAKNVRKEFGGKPGIWAYSESPLVDGAQVVCTPGGKEATMVALDKETGKVIWQCATPGADDAGYASAVIVETGGVRQYVQFMAKAVVGVEAKSGKVLWSYEMTAKGSPANIPTPTVDDDRVYTAGGRSGGGLVKLSAEGGKVEAEPIYFSNKLPNSIGGTVKVGDYLYGTNRQGLMCIDFKSGEQKWADKCVGPGSILAAEGLLYVRGESGEMALVEATAEGYHEKGRFKPNEQPPRGNTKAWAYPVISNGKLYLHDRGVLWCYDIAAEKAK